MSASKSFIKNAVGLLIVVAVCFVAVTIYKKGNASINSSISEYDEIISQFDNEKLKAYDNSTASGSQIIELLKTLKEEDGVKIVVSNGYIVKNKMDAEEYDYNALTEKDSTILADVQNKTMEKRYIKPNAFFTSTVVYDENQEISAIVFVQK